MIETKIISNASFFDEIEDMVWDQDISYLDAVIKYAEDRDIEIEAIGGLISKNQVLYKKIYGEAKSLKMIKHDDSDETFSLE